MMRGSTLSSRGTAPREWSDQELLAAVAVGATAVLWPIGLLLAWASGRWRLADKLIATALPVAGVALSLLVLPSGERGFGLSAPSGLAVGAEVAHYAALMGAPLLAAVYLGVRGGLPRRLVVGLVVLALVVLALGQVAFLLGARLHPGGM
ncbi:MAG: hypothetical protein N2Z82_03690 [Thermomicrobium sp.]|nr:hypothetical protein [Thermomicrobium sp.]